MGKLNVMFLPMFSNLFLGLSQIPVELCFHFHTQSRQAKGERERENGISSVNYSVGKAKCSVWACVRVSVSVRVRWDGRVSACE